MQTPPLPSLLAQLPTDPLTAASALKSATDSVADKDFKYWVVGLFFVGLAITIYIARWFSARHDAVIARMNLLEDARVADLKEDKATLISVVANNSTAFRDFTETIKSVQHLFQK